MNKSLRLVSSILLITVVSGCAHTSAQKQRGNTLQQQQIQTQEFVDSKMHETISSIDSSLNVLVDLTRGGEPARKSGPIGHTALGDATVAQPAIVPDTVPAQDVLKKTVHIQWSGSAEALLINLANQMGFTYVKGKTPFNKRINIEADGLTVEQTLEMIASQIGDDADLVVSIPRRTMFISGK